MIIGIPKEIKIHEYRVALTPSGCHELSAHGHQILIEHNAGAAIGFSDRDYAAAGAEIINGAHTIWQRAELIVKVKEPQPEECEQLKKDQLLFTYLHLAASEQLTDQLLKSGATALAYETVTNQQGHLPLLAPMSEVAGRMAIQAGAHCLEISQQGRGVLLAGVPGVLPAKVVILGGGVVGSNAAKIALGMGADTTIVDKSPARLQQLDEQFAGRIKTLFSTQSAIAEVIKDADLIVGAVLIPGASAPKLVSEEQLKTIPKGAVLVDVAIDQGGCFATSRPTTHQDPTYIEQDIVHYCVSNMPGAVARTSTLALTNATLPYICALANKGWRQASLEDIGFAKAVNLHHGEIICPGVATSFNRAFIPIEQVLEQGSA